MGEYETGYDPEVPEDLGEQDPEVPEDQGEQDPEVPADQEEPDPEAVEPEPEETGQEGSEAEPGNPDQEEGSLEEQPEDGTEEEPAPAEETEEPDPETVSENDLVVSGDVIIFPEEYDLSMLGGEPVDVDTESIVEAVEKQSDIMTAGFTCTCFMLGILAGALVIAGFRLRRV